MDRPTEKNKNKNTHEHFTNPHEPGRSDIIYDFIDSGPITNAMVLFTQSHAQEQVTEGNVQRTKEKFWWGDSEVHPGAGWRGALNYTPFWVEIGQKRVHVELRMRILTRPQALHDWERPSMNFWH